MPIVRKALTQFAWAILAVWGAVSIVFLATRMIGDPSAILLPVGATPEELDGLRKALGLDQPLAVQYLRFVSDAATGDFGESFSQARPALQLVLERFPATLMLATAALAMGVLTGLAAGACAALSPNRTISRSVLALASLGQATPAFWLGAMLIMIFSVHLAWTPTGGIGGARHLLLPALTLGTAIAASVARLFRASLLEVLNEDFIRTARAKGLSPSVIFTRHILPHALFPILALTAVLAGELLGGSVVVETVFAWPGIGRLLIQSISARDFPVVQAATILIAVSYVCLNLLADFGQMLLDPRLRYPRSGR